MKEVGESRTASEEEDQQYLSYEYGWVEWDEEFTTDEGYTEFIQEDLNILEAYLKARRKSEKGGYVSYDSFDYWSSELDVTTGPSMKRLMAEPCIRVRSEGEMDVMVHLAKCGYRGEVIVSRWNMLDVLFYHVSDSSRVFKYRVLEETRPIWSFQLRVSGEIPSIGVVLGPELSAELIVKCVNKGIMHVECWAHEEKEVGKALKKLFSDGVQRNDLCITAKYLMTPTSSANDIKTAIEQSCKALELDYVDFYLMEWPSLPTNSKEAESRLEIGSLWSTMESLMLSDNRKIIRGIGVCNFTTNMLKDLLQVAVMPPDVVQVECSPVCKRKDLHELCQARNIHISAQSPLGTNLFEDPVLRLISKNLGKKTTEVALRWGLQMGYSLMIPYEHVLAEAVDILGVIKWCIPDALFTSLKE